MEAATFSIGAATKRVAPLYKIREQRSRTIRESRSHAILEQSFSPDSAKNAKSALAGRLMRNLSALPPASNRGGCRARCGPHVCRNTWRGADGCRRDSGARSRGLRVEDLRDNRAEPGCVAGDGFDRCCHSRKIFCATRRPRCDRLACRKARREPPRDRKAETGHASRSARGRMKPRRGAKGCRADRPRPGIARGASLWRGRVEMPYDRRRVSKHRSSAARHRLQIKPELIRESLADRVSNAMRANYPERVGGIDATNLIDAAASKFSERHNRRSPRGLRLCR